MDVTSFSQSKQGGDKVYWTFQKLGYQARNFLRQEKINALLAEEQKQARGNEQEIAAYVNRLRLINTLASIGGRDIDEGTSNTEIAYVNAADLIDLFDAYGTLMYMDMKIGGKSIVIVDSGATHIFISSMIVRKYGLKVSDCSTNMKAVNSTTQASYGIGANVPLKIGH